MFKRNIIGFVKNTKMNEFRIRKYKKIESDISQTEH